MASYFGYFIMLVTVCCYGSLGLGLDAEDVLRRLESLENRESSHMATIASLKQQIQELQQDSAKSNKLIAKLTQTLVDKNDHIASLDRRIDVMQDRIDVMEDALDAYKGQMDDMERSCSQVGSTGAGESIRSLNRKQRILMDDQETAVAFHAAIAIAEIKDFVENQDIVFETIMLNTGGGYQVHEGKFTAPVPGLYVFSVSITSYKDQADTCNTAMVKNGDILANVYGYGDNGHHDQGSVTVAVQLKEGDKVWVKMLDHDHSVFGDKYTSFTGFLLVDMTDIY